MIDLKSILRVLSKHPDGLTSPAIAEALGDGVQARRVNPVLWKARDDGDLVSEWMDIDGVRWEVFRLDKNTAPIELGISYDWEAWETDGPEGMFLADVTLNGHPVEDVVRCRTGVDGFVEVIRVTEDGDPALSDDGGIQTAILRGRVTVKRRETPPSQPASRESGVVS